MTWESPQTALGHVTNTLATSLNLVKSVSSWGGATAVETYKSNWGAFTLGSYILGDRGLQADPNNSLFQHEYGHYLQSQHWGPSYLSRGALPSLFDTFGRGGDHQYHPIEQDANMRAFKYFNKNVEGFYKTQEEYDPKIEGGWNFAKNPLDIYGNGYSKYVDYHDADQMSLVNKLKVSSNLWEQFVGTSIFADPLPTLGYGLRNHVHYNKHKYTIY